MRERTRKWEGYVPESGSVGCQRGLVGGKQQERGKGFSWGWCECHKRYTKRGKNICMVG